MNLSDVASLYKVKKSKIKQVDDCIVWTGYKAHGRPMTTRNGKSVYVSRYLWELLRGPIPPRKCVLHTCDVPDCINIDHLWIGSCSDNVRDSLYKGRSQKAKLSADAVKEVLRLYYVIGSGVCAIGRKYNVASPSITYIVQGRHYPDLFKETIHELKSTEGLVRKLPTIHKE